MEAAITPKSGAFDVVFGHGAVAIPADHPAFTGAPSSRRFAGQRRAAALTVAGLLSVAALAAGTAHYVLEIIEPRIVSEAVAPAPAQIVAEKPLADAAPAAPALEMKTTTEPAMPATAAEEAAAPVAPSQIHKTKAAKLGSRAHRKKPAPPQTAAVEIERPPVVELPARIFTPVEPYPLTPKASN